MPEFRSKEPRVVSSPSAPYYVGIEIGGTKLQLGVGPGDGTLAGLWRETVKVDEGPEGIRRKILAGIPDLLAQSGVERGQVAGVGIGFGGPVDDATQTIIKSHQIENWDNFPLAGWISEMLDWPVALGNDADVAGLAEALFGAGKGLSPIFYITIGSGIGGGLIINGEIYRGTGRGASEIGHLRIADYGMDEELIRQPLELWSSGWSIEKAARARIAAGLAPKLKEIYFHRRERIRAQDVAEAARDGDEAALSILHDAWRHLAEAICQVIALLCPRRIVIGGGVALMGEDLLFGPVRKLVAEKVFQPFADCCEIVPAALGEEVVVHGALALARDRLAGRRQMSRGGSGRWG
jgi:glucokinase